MAAATAATRYWHRTGDGRVQCDVCPRACRLHEGQRGFCFVRMRQGDAIVLTTYGRSSGYCVDPIEKKPLNHFLPGTPVLSFGTAGCNLGCRFCQNWEISKSREIDTLADEASPAASARTASAASWSSSATGTGSAAGGSPATAGAPAAARGCRACSTGAPGTWGPRRLPVRLASR